MSIDGLGALPPAEKRRPLSRRQRIEIAAGLLLVSASIAFFIGASASVGAPLLPFVVGCLGVLGNVLVIRQLPYTLGIYVAWIELLTGFVAFCTLFNIQPGYVMSKLGALIGYQSNDGLAQGALLTLFICAISIAIATIVALAVALGKMFGSGATFGATTFYISFFRGTPLLLQVLIIYLGLPQIGWTISAIPAGILALSLNYGAYMAEIFRSGIQSIHKGQWEASDALGLSRGQSLRYVILPQSMRLIIPATGNQFIMMLKDSALVSIMGVWELMYVARAIGRADFRYMEMLIAAAIIYWVLSAVLELLQARLEKHYSRGVKR